MEVVQFGSPEAPSLPGVEAGGSEDPSLRGLSAFLKDVHSSVPFFYSSQIRCILKWPSSAVFEVVLDRRRSPAVEKCQECERSSIFRFVGRGLLEAIRSLVACPSWIHAQFSFWKLFLVNSVFENLMYEVFSLLRSSPSLTGFEVINPRFCYKQLPTLLYENPRLETLIVDLAHDSYEYETSKLSTKTIALCLSQNSVLKSIIVQIRDSNLKYYRESLEILLTPFTASFGQANTTLSALRIDFPSHGKQPEAFLDGLVVILNDLASMLKSNTTLKHVQLSHEYGCDRLNIPEAVFERRHVEFGTKEKLKSMICNELRVNTSLESFAVGFWKIYRVGTEWRMSYEGPCLKTPVDTYIVQVKMRP